MSAGGGGMTKSQKIAFIRTWLANTDFEAMGPEDIGRVTEQIDLQAEVDNSLSAAANWELIKDKFGLQTKGELEETIRGFEEQEIDRARREIRSQIDEYGVEQVTDAIVNNPDVPPDLEERVDSILEVFPPDVYDAEIRDRVTSILRLLDEDFRVIEADRIEELREQAGRPGRIQEARREILAELGSSFGQQFETVDEAVRALQQRIAQARGERLRIAPIEARRSGGDVLVRLEDGDEFDPFEELARRRARRGIAFPPEEPRTWTEVGEVRVRGGDLERISLERGVERFGAAEDAEDVPIVEETEAEQAGLPTEPERPGDDITRRALRLLTGGD